MQNSDWRKAYNRREALLAYLAEVKERTTKERKPVAKKQEAEPLPTWERVGTPGPGPNRRGRKPALTDAQIRSVSHLSIAEAAKALGVGTSTIQRSRARLEAP